MRGSQPHPPPATQPTSPRKRVNFRVTCLHIGSQCARINHVVRTCDTSLDLSNRPTQWKDGKRDFFPVKWWGRSHPHTSDKGARVVNFTTSAKDGCCHLGQTKRCSLNYKSISFYDLVNFLEFLTIGRVSNWMFYKPPVSGWGHGNHIEWNAWMGML